MEKISKEVICEGITYFIKFRNTEFRTSANHMHAHRVDLYKQVPRKPTFFNKSKFKWEQIYSMSCSDPEYHLKEICISVISNYRDAEVSRKEREVRDVERKKLQDEWDGIIILEDMYPPGKYRVQPPSSPPPKIIRESPFQK